MNLKKCYAMKSHTSISRRDIGAFVVAYSLALDWLDAKQLKNGETNAPGKSMSWLSGQGF